MCRNLRLVLRIAVSAGSGSPSAAYKPPPSEQGPSKVRVCWGAAWAVKCNKTNSKGVFEKPFQQLFVGMTHIPHS